MNGSKSIAQGANGTTSGSMASGTENVCKVVARDLRKGKTMSDYISREELLEKEKYLADWNIDLYYIDSDDVKMIPSADVRPNIHGHWESKYPTREEIIYCQERYFCSNCKNYVVDRIARLEFNFCPNCGADMREPK